MKIRVMHSICAQPAFLYELEAYAPIAIIESKHAAHLDGSPILPTEPMRCESCGRRIVETWRELLPELDP